LFKIERYKKELEKLLSLKICSICRRKTSEKLKTPIEDDNPTLIDILTENGHDISSPILLCSDCFNDFRLDKLPRYSILNNMFIDNVPKEISTLNFYEKLLIQKAKCFMTIIKLNSYGRNIHQMQAIKGLAVYLPLEQNSTQNYVMKTLPSADKLNFIVEGLPTKSNSVWRGLVNLEKVFIALDWLKINNKLYSDIIIDRSLFNIYGSQFESSSVPLNNSYLVSVKY